MAFLPPAPIRSLPSGSVRHGLSIRRSSPRCAAAVPEEPSAAAAASPLPSLANPAVTLSNWARCASADLTSLAISLSTPRGLVTRSPRKQGDLLIAVPALAALQIKTTDSRRSPLPRVVGDEAWAGLPWYARLAVLLLVERGEVDDGGGVRRVGGWAGLLPESFAEMPLGWTEAELGALQSDRMRTAVHRLRGVYRELFNAIARSGGRFVSYNRFVWAVQCVRSRSFAGELEMAPFAERVRLFVFVGVLALGAALTGAVEPAAAVNGAATAAFALAMYDVVTPRILGVIGGSQLKRYSLVPGVDFINHASRVNGKAEVSYEYFSDRFVVAAGEDYGAGDEVAISYGAQSNDGLLQFYGFVERDNPADDYVFDREVGDMLGLPDGKLRCTRAAGFDAATITSVAKARFGGDEVAAKVTLADLCRAELDGLPTSIAEDEGLLAAADAEAGNGSEDVVAQTRARLALEWRLEKKKVLRDVLSKMDVVKGPP